MKKVFVSIMMAAAIIAGSSAFAQTKADATTGATTQVEKCQKDGKDCKGEKKCKGDKKCKDAKDLKAKKINKTKAVTRQQFNPFEGVQLTDDQQQRLQVLQQGLGPVQLSKEQMAKIPENKNLTPEQKQQLKAERQANKMEAKKKYLGGVKEILTPEQYVIFLENVYLYSPQSQGNAVGMRQAKGKVVPTGDRSKIHKAKDKRDAKPAEAVNK